MNISQRRSLYGLATIAVIAVLVATTLATVGLLVTMGADPSVDRGLLTWLVIGVLGVGYVIILAIMLALVLIQKRKIRGE